MAQADASVMPGDFTLSYGMMQASSSFPNIQVDTTMVITMNEGEGASGSVDGDGEGFITLPDSVPRDDVAQVGEEPANLYMVIHASGINLCPQCSYLLHFLFYFASIPVHYLQL